MEGPSRVLVQRKEPGGPGIQNGGGGNQDGGEENEGAEHAFQTAGRRPTQEQEQQGLLQL